MKRTVDKVSKICPPLFMAATLYVSRISKSITPFPTQTHTEPPRECTRPSFQTLTTMYLSSWIDGWLLWSFISCFYYVTSLPANASDGWLFYILSWSHTQDSSRPRVFLSTGEGRTVIEDGWRHENVVFDLPLVATIINFCFWSMIYLQNS